MFNWKHMLEMEASNLYDACLHYQLTCVDGICNIAKNNKNQRQHIPSVCPSGCYAYRVLGHNPFVNFKEFLSVGPVHVELQEKCSNQYNQ